TTHICCCDIIRPTLPMPREKAAAEQAPNATHPPMERSTHSIDLINPNHAARWLTLADAALSRGASEQAVSETEALARKEQTAIKRLKRLTAEKVKKHSKSKQ